MVDLTTTYAGLNLKNPLVVGGGPNAATPRICEKAAKSGWAGVVLKINLSDEASEKLCVDPQAPMKKARPFYKLLDATGVRKWKPTVPRVRGKRERGKMADWEDTFGSNFPRPLKDSYREVGPNNVIRSEVDVGPPKIRKRQTAAIRTFSLSFFMRSLR